MKAILFALIAITFSSAPVWAQDTYVDGYVRSNETYVQPHFRSQTDGIADNNFSTIGNTNPYTGGAGSERTPSLGAGGAENHFNDYSPSIRPSREWNNSRPYGSSYRRPQSGM